MASNVVFSTLMVLLSNSELDVENFWDTLGAVNDPLGNKHEVNLSLAVQDGNFRSALIDDWTNMGFLSMYIQGTNKFGNVLWETELNVTGKSWRFSSWLTGGNIVNSSSLILGVQEIIYNDQNYRFRIGPSGSEDKSWFALSNIDLSYGPLPQIFVPRSPDVPFSAPVFLDGTLGCWDMDSLVNVHLMFSNDSITPNECIAACAGNSSVAVITVKLHCFCADVDPSNPPINNSSQCYLICTSTVQICGGFSPYFGSAFHVQGQYLPGHINQSLLLVKSFEPVSKTVEIDISTIDVASPTSPAFITNISVKSIPEDNYSVKFSTRKCSESSLSFDAVTAKVFEGDGTVEGVDMLMLRCLQIHFTSINPDIVHVKLWGPDVSSEHIEASALVIRGKSMTAAAATTTTSSTTADNQSDVSCSCHCNSSDSTLTEEQLQDKINEIRRNLAMNVSNLSSTIRKLTSADDKRVSAASIGYVGVGIMIIIVSAIVFIDSSLIYKDLRNFFDNVKHGIFCIINKT